MYYSMHMDFPAEHKGFVEKRKWYKVRWLKNPHPDNPGWKGIEGKADMMMEEDYDNFKQFVDVLDTIVTAKCNTAPGLRFGATPEEVIDKWVAENKSTYR